MAAVGPPVSHDANVGRVVGVGLTPVSEQVVDDGIEPFLGRIPWFEQVVVQADVVDRLDCDLGVGVCREQQILRTRCMRARLGEHLDAGHLRHPLIGGDQGNGLVTQGELRQHRQRLGS